MRKTLTATALVVALIGVSPHTAQSRPIAGDRIGSQSTESSTDACGTCQEDQVFAPTHFTDPNGTEDVHGVTRKCVAIDELGEHFAQVEEIGR